MDATKGDKGDKMKLEEQGGGRCWHQRARGTQGEGGRGG